MVAIQLISAGAVHRIGGPIPGAARSNGTALRLPGRTSGHTVGHTVMGDGLGGMGTQLAAVLLCRGSLDAAALGLPPTTANLNGRSQALN